MKEKVVADFVLADAKEDSWEYNTYKTDYTVIEATIQHWSEGRTAWAPDGERISVRHKSMDLNDTDLWLTSNDVPIGLNSAGTLIIAQYDLAYFTEKTYTLNAAEIHEIITHVNMAIDQCAEAAVWPAEVWHTFPRAESLDRILVPF